MHLHVVATDGVFVRAGDGVRFVLAAEPTVEAIERVVVRARKSILRWLRRKGYLDEQEPLPEDEPDGLDACQRTALSYGRLVRLPSAPPVTERRFEPRSTDRRHVRTEDGFDLDARVVIAEGDDLGRERLVRYCARPAVVLERLELLPDGRYSYRTKYARSGRTHRVMTGKELIARLAALVPPPRYPLIRYHGVFAPAHTWRRLVVPKPPPPQDHASRSPRRPAEPRPHRGQEPCPSDPGPAPPIVTPDELLALPELRSPFLLRDPHLRRLLDGLLLMKGPHADWATLLRRSHDIDVLDCPRCHGRLRLLAVIRDKTEARRFLAHLGKPSDPRTVAPARDPTLEPAA